MICMHHIPVMHLDYMKIVLFIYYVLIIVYVIQ